MKYIKFKSNGVDCLALYEYDETIKTLIFQLKGCFDIELRHIFIVRSLPFLNIKYRNYVKVPIPSSKEDDLNRGFNHVEEMFSLLKLQEQKVLVKTMNYKQSDHSKEDRGNIKNILAIYNNVSLKDKKVLIVDDIYTTGSTINAAIDLVKKSGAKTIKVLVIAKTILKTIES